MNDCFLKKRKAPVIVRLFWFFCLFPYLQLIPLGTDSQPWSLILGMMCLPSAFNNRFPKIFLLILLIPFFALGIALFSPLNFNTFRSLFTYLTLGVVPLISYWSLNKYDFPYRFLVFVSIVLLCVGLIQFLGWKNFGSWFVFRSTTTLNRGVTSLTPEPTFYGIQCGLLWIIAFFKFRYKSSFKLLSVILLIQIFILAQSSMMILVLLLTFISTKLAYIILKRPIYIFPLSATIICLFFLINLITPFLIEYRIGALLDMLIKKPEVFLIADESVNQRFVHAFFPFVGFFSNYGMPFGFGSFGEFINNIPQDSLYGQFLLSQQDNRIMSGLGSVVFELGIFGIGLVIVMLKLLRKSMRINRKAFFFTLLFIFISLNAMTFSNALMSFTLGLLVLYLTNNGRFNKYDIDHAKTPTN